MTRPQSMTHRPRCPEPGETVTRIGSWLLRRCTECKAVGIERAEDAS